MPGQRRVGLASTHIYTAPEVKATAAAAAKQQGRSLTDLLAGLMRDSDHLFPHRHFWQGDDRPELRCPGRDGGLDCHMILNHAGSCHG